MAKPVAIASSIKTLIKTGDVFCDPDEVNPADLDLDYIAGAIVWLRQGNTILGEREWDLVDQLWAYFINGMLTLLDEDSFECYFPDQPLLLRFDAEPNVRIRITIGTTSTEMPKDEFFSTLLLGAREFFCKLKSRIPSMSAACEHELQRIVQIEEVLERRRTR